MLEEGAPPITEITRCDVAKCFGYDLSGECSALDLVDGLFPLGNLAHAFVFGESLAQEIAQHVMRNSGTGAWNTCLSGSGPTSARAIGSRVWSRRRSILSAGAATSSSGLLTSVGRPHARRTPCLNRARSPAIRYMESRA